MDDDVLTITIKADRSDIDLKKHEEEVELCTDMLNGIFRFIEQNGWCHGYRNDMAVNFAIAYNFFADILGEASDDIAFNTEIGLFNTIEKATGYSIQTSCRVDIERRMEVIANYIEDYIDDPERFFIDAKRWSRYARANGPFIIELPNN